MSDRAQLEKAEARMLVPSYFATVALLGKPKANVWLTNQIAIIGKHYGNGFDARCRGYMREIAETELCDTQQG
jgi:hypothetical protein